LKIYLFVQEVRKGAVMANFDPLQTSLMMLYDRISVYCNSSISAYEYSIQQRMIELPMEEYPIVMEIRVKFCGGQF
jgi:hypothetical protein